MTGRTVPLRKILIIHQGFNTNRQRSRRWRTDDPVHAMLNQFSRATAVATGDDRFLGGKRLNSNESIIFR